MERRSESFAGLRARITLAAAGSRYRGSAGGGGGGGGVVGADIGGGGGIDGGAAGGAGCVIGTAACARSVRGNCGPS